MNPIADATRAEFFAIFSARFGANRLDVTDKRAVENAIRVCAFELLQRVEDIQALVCYLEETVEKWNGQSIAPFGEATGRDWLLNDQMEQTLKFIIRAIVSDLWSSGALYPSP